MKTFRVLIWRPELTIAKVLAGQAKWKDIDVLDNLISGHTFFWNSVLHPASVKVLWKLRGAHAEVWTKDITNEFINIRIKSKPIFTTDDEIEYTKEFGGLCWTSTMRYGEAEGDKATRGCVVRPAQNVLKHPERWYYWELTTEDEYYEDMIQWLQWITANNPGYGKGEIGSFFIPIRLDTKGIICSGHSREASVKARFFKEMKILFSIWKLKFTFDNWSPLLLSFNLWLLSKTNKNIKGPYRLESGKLMIGE